MYFLDDRLNQIKGLSVELEIWPAEGEGPPQLCTLILTGEITEIEARAFCPGVWADGPLEGGSYGVSHDFVRREVLNPMSYAIPD